MQLLKDYFELERKIHEYFGYKQDWVTIPLSDETEMYWRIDGDEVYYYEEPLTEKIIEDGNYYSGTIYTQRFLSKWIYRTDDYTMISVNTHVDGNKYLMVF